MKINIKGIKPFYHQRVVIDELLDWEKSRGKTVVVKSSRQKGKSVLCSQLLLKFALGFNRVTKNFYVAPTLRQSRMMFEMIVKGIQKANVIKKSNSTELTLEFINGSTIAFKSTEMASAALRGWTCTGLCVLDEAAFQPDQAFYSLIQPWVSVAQAPILLLSTPFTRSGFFYQHYVYGLEHTHNCVTIDWSDEIYRESVEQLLPQEKLAEYEQMLPKKIFRNEYLGEWADLDGLVFDIRDCVKDAKITPNDRLYCGIDWANQGQGDYTVLTMFNQNGEQVFLKYWNSLTPLSQIDVIYRELEPYIRQIQNVTAEINSIGTPYVDLLKQKNSVLASKINGFVTTNQSKNTIVTNFQVALEGKQVTLLPDEKQKNEFAIFSCDFNPKTRTITYAAAQGHDDTVLATLFAYDGMRLGISTGNYNVTFRVKKIGHPSRGIARRTGIPVE